LSYLEALSQGTAGSYIRIAGKERAGLPILVGTSVALHYVAKRDSPHIEHSERKRSSLRRPTLSQEAKAKKNRSASFRVTAEMLGAIAE
jgi:hypothetical protein